MNLGLSHEYQELNDTNFDFDLDSIDYPSESNKNNNNNNQNFDIDGEIKSRTRNIDSDSLTKRKDSKNRDTLDATYSSSESNRLQLSESNFFSASAHHYGLRSRDNHSSSSTFAADSHNIGNINIHSQSTISATSSQPTASSSTSSIASTLINDFINDHNKRPEGYKLRALTENISSLQSNPWSQATAAQNLINASSLSSELVNETLNYFVNCGQRSSQMTKTYDDNDAYLLLLQEKEVDLELAARIGQDLLKQNKQLRDSIRSLETELVKRQDDVQQLKHELASKTSLLDTFIEEEEHQTTLDDYDEESTPTNSRAQELGGKAGSSNSNNAIKQLARSNHQTSGSDTIDGYDESGCSGGFLSLNYINQKSLNSAIEPFSSLPYNLISNVVGEQSYHHKQHISNKDESSSVLNEELNDEEPSQQNNDQQQKLIQNVTSQLVESNKRLCELQDEILSKSEQYTCQQEKIFKLHEQLKDTEKRLGDLAQENEALKNSMSDSLESQKELNEELKVCKKSFSELLDAFLELQKENRLFRQFDLQKDSNLNYLDVMLDPLREIQNISFDQFYSNQGAKEILTMPKKETTVSREHPRAKRANNHLDEPIINLRMERIYEDRKTEDGHWSSAGSGAGYIRSGQQMGSSSLHEEFQECMQRDGCPSYCDDSSDGDDSGVHTSRRGRKGNKASGETSLLSSGQTTTMSVSPSTNGLATDNDDDEDHGYDDSNLRSKLSEDSMGRADDEDASGEQSSRANWLGISSFVLTTLLILCLSAAMSPSSNLNTLAQRFQVKIDK